MLGTSDRGTDASRLFERLEAERIALRQQFENLHHVLKGDGWASSGLTDIQHQGQSPGKDVQYGDHGAEEAPSPSVVHLGVQG